MKPQQTKPNREGLAGLLSAVLAQSAAIQAADDSTEGKANNLMAAALVIIALIGVQLKDADGHWHGFSIVAMLVLAVVVGLAIYLTRNQAYYETVADLNQHNEYFGMEDSALLAQLINDATFANEWNSAIVSHKQKLFKWSVGLFLAGFVLGIVALFINA